MKLHTKTSSFIVVDSSDLDDFIQFHYGAEYSTTAMLEARNGTEEVIRVDGVLNEWDYEALSNIATEGVMSIWPNVFLNEFATRGLIEKGDYLIRFSW